MKIRWLCRKLLKVLNEKIAPASDASIIDAEFGALYRSCAPYLVKTTTTEGLYALYKAVEYIVYRKIPGDVVECGVWKGGGAMLIARTLLKFGETQRKLYLYDTFAGMTEPTAEDTAIPNGSSALERWRTDRFSDWGAISLEEVQENLRRTGYPEEGLIFAKGAVEL